jgi:hypothetical protein
MIDAFYRTHRKSGATFFLIFLFSSWFLHDRQRGSALAETFAELKARQEYQAPSFLHYCLFSAFLAVTAFHTLFQGTLPYIGDSLFPDYFSTIQLFFFFVELQVLASSISPLGVAHTPLLSLSLFLKRVGIHNTYTQQYPRSPVVLSCPD